MEISLSREDTIEVMRLERTLSKVETKHAITKAANGPKEQPNYLNTYFYGFCFFRKAESPL